MKIRHLPLACTVALATLAPVAAADPPAGKASSKHPEPKLPSMDDATFVGNVRATLPPKPAAGRSEVVLVTMRGEFAEFGFDGQEIGTAATKLMLDLAKERKPQAIVIDIDSPGGLVTTMYGVIDELLKLQSGNVRVVAWPSYAGSAAAVTCLSCREIVARPTTVIGAATKVIGDDAAPKPVTAMDHKHEAVENAFRRQMMQIAGRDMLVLDAMQLPEKQLWFSEKQGFRATPPTGDGWTALDTSTEAPAALNAEELVHTRLAKGKAASTDELLQTIGLKPDTMICRIDLADPKVQAVIHPISEAFGAWHKWRDEEIEAFRALVNDRTVVIHKAIKKVEALKVGDGWSDADQDSLTRLVNNCANIPKLSDALKRAAEGTRWSTCAESRLNIARDEIRLARNSAAPQSTGSGRVVNLHETREHLVLAYNALIDLWNGCPPQEGK